MMGAMDNKGVCSNAFDKYYYLRQVSMYLTSVKKFYIPLDFQTESRLLFACTGYVQASFI